jgi:hypothetical protein
MSQSIPCSLTYRQTQTKAIPPFECPATIPGSQNQNRKSGARQGVIAVAHEYKPTRELSTSLKLHAPCQSSPHGVTPLGCTINAFKSARLRYASSAQKGELFSTPAPWREYMTYDAFPDTSDFGGLTIPEVITPDECVYVNWWGAKRSCTTGNWCENVRVYLSDSLRYV